MARKRNVILNRLFGDVASRMIVSWFTIIDFTKAQLTLTACERLFCSLSDAFMGVSCHWSRLQVAVGCTPMWTATSTRLGCQDSGRLLSQLRMEFEEEALLWPFDYSWAHATARRVLATATLRCRPVWFDTDCWIAFFFADDTGINRRRTLIPTAFCRSCELLIGTLYKTNDIFTIRNVTAISRSRYCCADVRMSWP